jgi:hypothetical protein
MRQGYGHLAEHRRPELPDPQRGAAVRQVHEGVARTQLRLLIPERRCPVKGPEEVGLERGLGRPLADHRLPGEVEADARVPDVAVEDRLVEPWLGHGCPLRALPL